MTTKRSNGAHAPDLPFSMNTNVATPFLLSQRVALEAARFWARRMRAYADQMEVLASCKSPEDLVGAQSQFFDRLREDYANESEAVQSLMKPAIKAAEKAAETRADA